MSKMRSEFSVVVGKKLKQREFYALRDKILEFYKKHNKLNVFYCGEDFIGWSLGLGNGFNEDDYETIFEWVNTVIVGIEYEGGGVREINKTASELEELFGISADDMEIHHL